MKRLCLLILLMCFSFFSSGCVVALIAAVRWDQRRWNAQQEAKRAEEEKRKAESSGGSLETDGESRMHEVPGTEETDTVPVQTPVE